MNAYSVRLFKPSPPEKRRGVSCDANGAFIDDIPLLKRVVASGQEKWMPRDGDDISTDLSKRFGFPIDFSSKTRGVTTIARALNEGSVARAQLAALFLRFPEPPSLAKNAASRNEWIAFSRRLAEAELIKARWNVRWPAASPDSQGGRFAPGNSTPGEPGIGHNGGPPLEAEEVAAADDAAAAAGEGAAVALAPIAAIATEALALSTVPAGSGEDEAVARLKHDEFERTERHHPWPKYLGGAEDQELVELPRSLHIAYHRGVQSFAAHRAGTAFYDNLSPEERAAIFRKLVEFTKQFDSNNGTDLLTRMLRNGFPSGE